jgi:hypothetical protein
MVLRDMTSVYAIGSGFCAIMSQKSKSFWAIPKACGTRPDRGGGRMEKADGKSSHEAQTLEESRKPGAQLPACCRPDTISSKLRPTKCCEQAAFRLLFARSYISAVRRQLRLQLDRDQLNR